MSRDEYPSTNHRSPSEIRHVRFSHRIRGLDEYEVGEYLDLLADQVEAMQEEADRLREEVARLRAENDRLRDTAREPSSPVDAHDLTPHAASLLLHAQQLADALVEEAVRRSSDLLAAAGAERRAMLRRAEEAGRREAHEGPTVGPTVGRVSARQWRLDSHAAV